MDKLWYDVNDMYTYSKTNDLKLLSDYPSGFWQGYVNNSVKYDKLFNRLYKSYRYFNQDICNKASISELTLDFIDEVYNHLLLNDKKYSELYRVYVLADEDNKLLDNYNYTEVMNRKQNEDKTIVSGARTDKTDDTSTITTGARKDNTSETVNTTQGARNDVTESEISGFNSAEYQDANNKKFTKGEEVDNTVTEHTFDKGVEVDTDVTESSFVKGEQSDNHFEESTDNYTLTRTGKTGDSSNSDFIKKHISLWDNYRFYYYIFNEICSELLLV